MSADDYAKARAIHWDRTTATTSTTISADVLARSVVLDRPDLDGYTPDEAYEAGVHAAFAAIRETHFGSTTPAPGTEPVIYESEK